MKRTSTSLDSVASPSLQSAQFSIAFVSPGRTHAAELRWHFRRLNPAFPPQTGPCGRLKRLRSAMNPSSASTDSLASPSLQLAHSPSRLSHLEEPTVLDRGGISGDLTRLFSTNGALSAVKGTEKCNEAHVELRVVALTSFQFALMREMSQTGLKIPARFYVTSHKLLCTRELASTKCAHLAHTTERICLSCVTLYIAY